MRSGWDLIETYWDVKIFELDKFNLAQEFNRNILGCKGQGQYFTVCFLKGFNRNILGCKVFTKKYCFVIHFGFNRNILGCKERSYRRNIG